MSRSNGDPDEMRRRSVTTQEAAQCRGRLVEGVPVDHVPAVELDRREAIAEVASERGAQFRPHDLLLLRDDQQARPLCVRERHGRARHLAPARDRGSAVEAHPVAAVRRLVEVPLDILGGIVDRLRRATLDALRERLVGRRPPRVVDHVVGQLGEPRARQLDRRIQQRDASDALGRRREQVQRDHPAVGVPDHLDALHALGIERLEQVGDVLLDRPGPVPGRAPVPAQVDRQPAALRECLLREAAVALAVGRDAVDRERGSAVGRTVVMKIEDSHRAVG